MKYWDIFCKVIDNYGDAGICWRLARQLVQEYHLEVRLWIDDLVTLAQLVPDISINQSIQLIYPGVTICQWTQPFPTVHPADVVLEVFACHIPECYLHAMNTQTPQPIWINLEYLNHENWVTEYHKLVSPHPFLPLNKYFFFPGLTAGGLLHEYDLQIRQQSWTINHLSHSSSTIIKISLFSYYNRALPSLLEAWSQGPYRVHCSMPNTSNESTIKQIHLFFNQKNIKIGTYIKGFLYFEIIPFTTQEDYDRLLWQSDLNFVRGEDSFVRGQLAGKPIIWHIYSQNNNAHLDKLNAFLNLYMSDLSGSVKTALHRFHLVWNTQQDNCIAEWQLLLHYLNTLKSHAQYWRKFLFQQDDLAKQLYIFAHHRKQQN